MAFERGPDAERDYRDACRVAQPQYCGDFLIGMRVDNDIGKRNVGHALAVSMLLADGVACYCALREVLGQLSDDGRDIGRRGACT